MRFIAADRRKRDGRGRGQHDRDIERDGGDAKQAAAGCVILVAGACFLRKAVGTTITGVTMDSSVGMLVHCASVHMRPGLGFCHVDMCGDRHVIQAMRIGAERDGGMRGENAKRIEHGERERRPPMPPDRFEQPGHL
jgi:hypothetical protein